jgi:hypothetical protein
MHIQITTSSLSEPSLAHCVYQTSAQPYIMHEYLERSKLDLQIHDGTLRSYTLTEIKLRWAVGGVFIYTMSYGGRICGQT